MLLHIAKVPLIINIHRALFGLGFWTNTSGCRPPTSLGNTGIGFFALVSLNHVIQPGHEF
jgi:hypothetical protein